MTVTVTQRDIDLGECGNPGKCPLARAIRRVVHELTYVRVHLEQFSLSAEQFKSTRKMRNFVEAFDGELTVKPTTFNIPIPSWHIKPSLQKIK